MENYFNEMEHKIYKNKPNICKIHENSLEFIYLE